MADDAGEGLGAPPILDPLEVAVAQARIESAMFGNEGRVTLGRYQLLEKVGAGGFGVVWGAWDPQLERRVAIKLVQAGKARERILVEGQALAKLSHPNVVPVHDVGTIEDQVYIVMEWVRGQTLRAYCKEPRTVREILAIYRAAGEGLAAVHEAGLVHRDFKPDNAIVGDDGRVRVLDFGLARGEVQFAEGSDPGDSNLTRGAGTPRYMPPEQAEGKALTHAADQYALCASLREAIVATSKVPAWIDAILERGLARDPAARFPSMHALLRALAHDPARVWRRRAIAVAVLAAATAAFVVGRARSAEAVEPCVGGAEELAVVYNPTVRDALVAHLQKLGAYGAGEATRLVPAIDNYRDRWTRAHHTACMAQERKELTPVLYERNLSCLERSRASYKTVLDVLGTVPAPRLADAVVALRELPDVDRCLANARTSTVIPPSAAIAADVTRIERAVEEARVRAIAAEPDAHAKLAALSGEAERLAYAPLAAHTLLVHGFALVRIGETTTAIPLLDRAIAAAFDAGDDVTVVEAYARQVYAIAITPLANRPAELADPIASLRMVERIAGRLKTAGSFAVPLLYNNVGIAQMSKPDEAAALHWFSRAHDSWKQMADPSVELMYIPANLALAVADRTQQRALFDESAARFAAALGPQHPFALEFRTRAGMFIQHPSEAARTVEEACAQLRALHPHLVSQIYGCTYEVGWLAVERGDTAAARGAFAAMLALTPSDSEDPTYRQLAQAQLAMIDGGVNATRDAILLAESLTKRPEWWIRLYAADAFLIAATTDARQLVRARDMLNDTSAGRSQTYYQRRVARVQYLLARTAGDRVAAAAAAAWYRESGGYESAVTELDAITGSR